MKKNVLLLLSLLLVLLLVSCGGKKAASATSDPDMIDFTKMNPNMSMAAGILNEILETPEKYAGRTLKIRGNFYTEENADGRMYAIILWDSTRCCPTSIAFSPKAEYSYPKDFPKLDKVMTITGTISKAKVNGYETVLVLDASIK